MRICSKCKHEKSLDNFYKCKNEKLGYDYRCKQCHSEKSKERWIKNRSSETKIRKKVSWITEGKGVWFFKGYRFIPFKHTFFDNYYLVLYSNGKFERNLHVGAIDPFDACKNTYDFLKRKKTNKNYYDFSGDILSRLQSTSSAGELTLSNDFCGNECESLRGDDSK